MMSHGEAEFIRVLADGACVAAAACQRQGPRYGATSFGWLEGSGQWLKAGAMGAIYWSMLQRAYALGCTELDLGGAPPFLNNGLLGYKSKWGSLLVPEESQGYPVDHLLLNPSQPGWRGFVENHPLIVWGSSSSFEACSVQAPEDIPLQPGIRSCIQRWHRFSES
jgi:hypothetical protein